MKCFLLSGYILISFLKSHKCCTYIPWVSLLEASWHSSDNTCYPSSHKLTQLSLGWVFSITARITWSFLFLHLTSQINWQCLEGEVCLTFSPELQCIEPGSEGLNKHVMNKWMIPRSPPESYSHFWLSVEGYLRTISSTLLLSNNSNNYSTIKKNTFESVLMRWMKLEPIIQSEVSQKEKHQYSILTHIYGI